MLHAIDFKFGVVYIRPTNLKTEGHCTDNQNEQKVLEKIYQGTRDRRMQKY